jgi:uncharacterized protein
MPIFAVTNQRGSAYQTQLPLEKQVEWEAHADFMDALVSDGFVILGGPLEGTDEVLLIVRASSTEEISARLRKDPWHKIGLLHISQILPWTLRLGRLPS